MTPSEIAEKVEWMAGFQASETLRQAAATIRELETERDTWKAMAENNGRAIIVYVDKLKIATEALEIAEPSLARVHRAHIARKALARIDGDA